MSGNGDDCPQLLRSGASLEPEPDISGIGVLAAYMLSAYITFAVTLAAYLYGLIDEQLLGTIDVKTFGIRDRRGKHSAAHAAIRSATLALGDQQIVTGIAIMCAGFLLLGDGSISVYHFQVVVYLAWMSSSVHLSALTLLGYFLRQRKALLIWRLNGMLLLLVLLVVGFVPTVSNDWGILNWPGMPPGHTGWGIPAVCFWGRLWGNGVSPDAVLGLLLLGVSYVWKVGALFASVRCAYNRRVRYPLQRLLIIALHRPAKEYMASKCTVCLWKFRLFLSLTLPIFLGVEVAASFAASLWLSALTLVFGTLQVVIPRSQVISITSYTESTWSFAQLVPLILLVQPIGAVAEHLWVSKGNEDRSGSIEEAGDLLDRPTASIHEFLLRFIATQQSSKLDETQRATLVEILLQSKLSSTVIWFVQIAILVMSTCAFITYVSTIGYTRTGAWTLLILASAISVVLSVCLTLALLPFSRLGRLG